MEHAATSAALTAPQPELSTSTNHADLPADMLVHVLAQLPSLYSIGHAAVVCTQFSGAAAGAAAVCGVALRLALGRNLFRFDTDTDPLDNGAVDYVFALASEITNLAQDDLLLGNLNLS